MKREEETGKVCKEQLITGGYIDGERRERRENGSKRKGQKRIGVRG